MNANILKKIDNVIVGMRQQHLKVQFLREKDDLTTVNIEKRIKEKERRQILEAATV